MKTGVALAMAITMAAPAAAGAQTTIRPSPEQRTRQEKNQHHGRHAARRRSALRATQVAKGVRSVDSNASLMSGTARAKGFPLEGHGVFFYVEIPALDLSVMLSMEQIRAQLARSVPSSSRPAADTQQVTDVRRELARRRLPTAAESLANIAAEGQKYRATVRLALIDAMLDNSKNLELGPDEWLTIAARGSEHGLSTERDPEPDGRRCCGSRAATWPTSSPGG